jgi:hypothetical protein
VHARGRIEISLGAKHGLSASDQIALFRRSGGEETDIGTGSVHLVLDGCAEVIVGAAVAEGVRTGDRVRILLRQAVPENSNTSP